MNSKYAWILCLLILALNGCATSEDDLFGTLSGIVTDGETKEPLKGVLVSMVPVGDTKETGSDGAYTFLSLEPIEYTLTFKKEGYETDTKKVTVIAGGNSKVDMALVPLRPKLSVSLKTLEFGTENTTLTFDINNTGYGVLQWSITEDIEWLECKPVSGNVEKETASVVVTVSREGWAKGEYSRTFAISSNGGSEVITANMAVDGCNLIVEPKEIDFGTTESTAQLTLTNKGKGSISYEATSSNDWLNLSKTTGKVSEKDYITVSVNRGALAAGEYSGTITFTVDKDVDVINIPVKLSISAQARPVVSLDGIKNIAYNGATLAGTIVNVGNSKITRYGFCWSQKAEPTIEDAFTNMGDCSVPLSFEGVIIDLAADTKYFIRAYAENNEGISYSNEKSFTTAGVPVIPTVQTQQTTDVSSNKATAHGQITNLGNVTVVTQYGHVWSSTSEQPDINLTTKTTLGKTDKPLVFTSEMKELKSNQKYYIRAYATNEKGTAYGEVLEFTTAKADMRLSTSEVTSIVHNAATCGGLINDYGGHSVKECGVCWSLKEEAVSVADNKTVGTLKDNSWSCRMEELAKETTYYVRAYVETTEGTVFYGGIRSFTTTQEVKLPALSKVTVTGVDTQGATLQSNITDNGNSDITACGFCWSTNTNPTTDDESVACQLQNNAFGQKISGLKDGTKYYVRAYATNAMGTAYSENAEMTTTAVTIPEWGNASVTNIGKTKVNVSASLVSDGNAKITEMGICWSTHPETTIYDNKQVCDIGSSIATQLAGLQGTTTYYLRVYAQNSKGIGYSNEVVFTTTDSEVDVWDGISVATKFDGGSGTEIDPIIINEANQLALLAKNVNLGTTYAGVHFQLSVNIGLGNHRWTVIGNTSHPFKGIFNGNGYMITGLYINNYIDEQGLFGAVGGSIHNLTVEGSINARNYVGGVCARLMPNGELKQCTNKVNIVGNSYTGGVCGYNHSGTICNNINYGAITGNGYIGGILGFWEESSQENVHYTLYNCANYGNIISTDAAGGIIGQLKVTSLGGTTSKFDMHRKVYCNIYNCANYAKIEAQYAGGICGYVKTIGSFTNRTYGKETYLGIADARNCINNATIISNNSAGAIYGYAECAEYTTNWYGGKVLISSSYWLNDVANQMGLEPAYGNTNDTCTQEACGWYSHSGVSCTLNNNGSDILALLNQWVFTSSTAQDVYKHWKYETVDGFACPVLE